MLVESKQRSLNLKNKDLRNQIDNCYYYVIIIVNCNEFRIYVQLLLDEIKGKHPYEIIITGNAECTVHKAIGQGAV